MTLKINDDCTWVGKIDWELRKFHGEEYSTKKGSSYNSYLVKDEKVALIDTVWGKYACEYVENLKKTIPLEKIDYVIVNHGETDHSGSLPELMRLIPGTPIYCTANGVKSLKGHYHQDWNFQVVKTGDRLRLGSKELIFFEAQMLHWPDTMMTYLTRDNILFSNDAFGQHLASEFMYNDLVDQSELFEEAMKYYANILTPFSLQVDKKIKELAALNLPIHMICPSHGVMWRKAPLQIIEKYTKWANCYAENQITVVYDTMWDGTRHMAEAIISGITEVDPQVTIKLFNVSRSDKTEVINEVFKSKAILVGSSTINNGVLRDIAAILEEIKGMKFRNKKAAAFGCYGWSGESVRIITERLAQGGFQMLNEGICEKWDPDIAGLDKCIGFGKEFAIAVK
jgi:anaerobic nitric oxide reductase flavorubredoxin